MSPRTWKNDVCALAFTSCLLAFALPAQPPHPADDATATWRLRGRAVDEHGKPIEGVSVALEPDQTFTTLTALASSRAKTGADGRFELTVEDPTEPVDGRVPLLVAEGWTTVLVRCYYEGIVGEAEHTYDRGDIVLQPGKTLRGHVRTAGGRPLPGARVVARDALALLFHGEECDLVTAAITDDAGAFELHGVGAGGSELTFTAPGHHQRKLPFVGPGEPIVVELMPGGWASGVVKDASGRPCAGAYLSVLYVAGETEDRVRAGADGTFSIPLAFPHAYRIGADAETWRFPHGGESGVAVREGPANDIELTAGVAVDPGRTIVVRTIDAATGKAIEEVRATAMWADPEMLEHLRDRRFGFHDAATSLRGPGEIRLPGPGVDEPATGVVIIAAEGYAPLVLEDVTWSDTEPPRLEAKLVRESVLAGVVVDARSGEPVPGAMVLLLGLTATPWFPMRDEETHRLAEGITDDTGRFRLGNLGAGRYRVRTFQVDRPRAEAIDVEVGAAETKDDLRLALSPGTRLSGKLIGIEPGAGWQVLLRPIGTGRDHLPVASEGGWPAPRPVAADGGFSFPGLAPGNHELRLRIPHRGGRGGWLDLPIEPLRIRTSDLERDFDVSEALPGTIRGTVTVTGASIARQRLVIAAFLPPGEGRLAWPEWPYVLEPVAADGSFALPVAPGRQRIELIDLATRIPLAVANGVEASARKTTELPLRLELVAVRAHLKPEREGGVGAASRLEVVVGNVRPRAGETDFVFGDFDSGVGVDVAGRAGDVELLLPPRPTKLVVRSNHAPVYQAGWERPPLGEAEFTPTKDGDNLVEIVVRTPPKPERK